MMTEIAKSLRDTILAAKSQGRVKYGVLQAAKAMETPENVMLCILTVDDIEDLTAHMYRTLIEAFCCENEIRVIKVSIQRILFVRTTSLSPLSNLYTTCICDPNATTWSTILCEFQYIQIFVQLIVHATVIPDQEILNDHS